MDVNRVKGCIFGQALGDAVGAYTEFRTKKMIRKDFPTDEDFDFPPSLPVSFMKRDTKCDWTDDTDQLILIMEVLTETGTISPTLLAQKLVTWKEHGFTELGDKKGYGLGGYTGRVLNDPNFIQDPLGTAEHYTRQTGNAANGSLMRTAVIACQQKSRNQVLKEAILASKVTHPNKKCTQSVILITDLIYSLIQGKKPKVLKSSVYSELAGLNLDDTDMGYVLKCRDVGIWAYRNRNRPYKDVIKEIVLEGGDADTNSAVAGAILGAFIGYQNLPQDWLEKLPHREWLEKKVDEFIRKK
jgi:ADP-ribosylglycohydrolase